MAKKPQVMAGTPKRGDQKVEKGQKYRWNGKVWVKDHSWGGVKKTRYSSGVQGKNKSTPTTVATVDKPKRSDYPDGATGQAKYNLAYAKWNRSKNKTPTKPKPVSKEVQAQIDKNLADKNKYKDNPSAFFGTNTKLTIGDQKPEKNTDQKTKQTTEQTTEKKTKQTTEQTTEKKTGSSENKDTKPVEKLKVKPRRMGQIERENRARFGHEAVNHLQKKQIAFKKMQSGEITKAKFMKDFPNSITAREHKIKKARR